MEDPGTSRNDGQSQASPSSLCYPTHRCHRFIGLILMCFLCFGSYFCYDTPGALADKFKNDLHLNTSQVALLYSIYSWPNIVLCIIGGYLLDKYFGVRWGTIIYIAFVFVGAVIFSLGAYLNIFGIMILGRFIFGIGGESLQVAANNYVVLWFKGKELNMVFGLQLSFSRLGSTVNFLVMDPVYRWVSNYYAGYERLGAALFIASLTCLVSLICALILGWMDSRAEKTLGRQEDNANEEPFRFSDVGKFNSVFWLVSVICVMYYLAIFPFVALGKLFFERKFDFLPQNANAANSMTYLLSSMLSPFFGVLIDKTGRNVTWVIISILTSILAHAILAFTFENPYIGVIILGMSYSLLASGLWPLVALIVAKSQLGTAYGICQAVQNFGLAAVMVLAGMIVDKYGYLMLEMFFLVCLFISLAAAVLIYIVDSASGGSLNMSTYMRELVKQNKHEEETSKLLENEDVNEDITDRGAEEVLNSSISSQDRAQLQSDRIRSRYLAQILPNTNMTDSQIR